jgi:hypothetical protein
MVVGSYDSIRQRRRLEATVIVWAEGVVDKWSPRPTTDDRRPGYKD